MGHSLCVNDYTSYSENLDSYMHTVAEFAQIYIIGLLRSTGSRLDTHNTHTQTHNTHTDTQHTHRHTHTHNTHTHTNTHTIMCKGLKYIQYLPENFNLSTSK